MDGGGGPHSPPSKLRLMCSYGGQIVPRTHDKSLCYIGGDTRLVAIDRNNKISISELNHRLSKTLNPQNQQFILKYQLPNEDLDSLISVSTDEDLENMIDEYDRLNSSKSSGGGGRIRLFLFPKSAANSVEGGFSESSLLGLDDDFVVKNNNNNNNNNNNSGSSGGVVNQDVHSVPGSPMLNNTTSSFGSTSSPKVGIEEQFQQMSVNFPVVQKHPEQGNNRVFSDDERSDHGGYRLVQQIQPQVQQLQYQQKKTSAFDLPSPDSISSEGSLTNPLSRQRQVIYQEPFIQIQPKTMDQNNTSAKIQMQPQNQESEYVLSTQYDQNPPPQFHQHQQFVHTGGQYIPSGAMPMQSYYHIYPHQPVLDHQYPAYYMPAKQPIYNESTPNATLSRPQMAPPGAYNQSRTGPPGSVAQQFVPAPLGHHQGQYGNFSQFQSMTPSSAAQMHYTQCMQPQLASKLVLPEASPENIKQQQP